MDGNMRVPGRIITCMERGSTHGGMADAMKVSGRTNARRVPYGQEAWVWYLYLG